MDITVKDLADELGLRISEISVHVSALCREQEREQVVREACSSNGPTLLHGKAADEIRTRVRALAESPRLTPFA